MTSKQHRIVITPGPPPGFHEAGTGPLLACDQCGALIVELGLHAAWHDRQMAASLAAVEKAIKAAPTGSSASS
jgi:hypothetical protein